MPLDFKPRVNSALDENSGISIPQPRMLPSALPDGGEGIEYQYVFRRDNTRIGGLGIFGAEVVLDRPEGRERLYTLDLTQDSAIEGVRHFKKRIGAADGDFDFLRDVANGLVNVFAGQVDNVDAQRNVAVTSVSALARNGVQLPAGAEIPPDGVIVLAEVFVPAHGA